MLQGKDIKIFQIVDIKINPSYIEFSLYYSSSNPNTSVNNIKCANHSPFARWQIGEHIGINISKLEKFYISSLTKIVNDTSIVARVIKPATIHPQQKTFGDFWLGNGWVEKEE